MSRNITKSISKKGKEYKLNIEYYDNTAEMVSDLRSRPITHKYFEDKSKQTFGKWEGVKTYDECLQYLQNGYSPVVDELKKSIKPSATRKRISFKNNIVGGSPIVPLAMMGIPNSMIDTYIKPIKSKVVDIYYDITCSSSTDSQDIIEAGQKLLETVLRFEQEGYKFNLYAVQSYTDDNDADMLAIKVKSSNQPLDLKRMSYPLTHTSFFRVLGFDWYSRTPKGKYRSCYGCNFSSTFDYNEKVIAETAKQIFGDNAIYLSAMIMNRKYKNGKDEYIKNTISVK